MKFRSLARISLPKDEYVYLLVTAMSVFISNNGFIMFTDSNEVKNDWKQPTAEAVALLIKKKG